MLRQLDGREADVGELAASLAESMGCETSEAFERHIDGVVSQLDELGLIEPVP